MVKRVSVIVQGRVQGVGFRYYTKDIASEMNLYGFAKNNYDGSVEIEVQGEADVIEKFVEIIRVGPQLAKVLSCKVSEMIVIDQDCKFIIKH